MEGQVCSQLGKCVRRDFVHVQIVPFAMHDISEKCIANVFVQCRISVLEHDGATDRVLGFRV